MEYAFVGAFLIDSDDMSPCYLSVSDYESDLFMSFGKEKIYSFVIMRIKT